MICCGGSHGHWAQVPETPSKSSDSHKPQPSTILVSAEELAHVKESGSLSAVRAGSSTRAIVISPGVVKAKLSAKTRVVSVELNRKHLATVFRLEGGC